MIDGSLKYIFIYISTVRRKLIVKEKTQFNCGMSNDNGNRRHRTEHNKKKCSLLDSVRVCETELTKVEQEKKSAKKRVISATSATVTTAGAASDVPP